MMGLLPFLSLFCAFCCFFHPLLKKIHVNSLAIRSDLIWKRTSLQSSARRYVPLRKKLWSSFEYEFLPFDDDDDEEESTLKLSASFDSSATSSPWSNLPSSYPPHTPAGLRGEAIRSALMSDSRCVAWKNEPSGLIQLKGQGVMDFLQAKLTKSFSVNNLRATSTSGTDGITSSYFTRACLLNAKGQVVDGLSVAVTMDGNQKDAVNKNQNNRQEMTAWWLTSMGFDSRPLVEQLDAMIFPLDQVQVQHIDTTIVTLASTQLPVVQKVIRTQVLPFLQVAPATANLIFPHHDQIGYWETTSKTTGQKQVVLLLPTTGLPPCFSVGYTICCLGDSTSQSSQRGDDLGQQLWQHLAGDANAMGPIAVGRLEYESLRIQAGQPAFGSEYHASLRLRRPKRNSELDSTADATGDKPSLQQPMIPPSPLELHMQDLYLDLDRKEGCYLGQEGLASIIKNPRGPPRTLYQVVFDDNANIYDETPGERRRNHQDNLTKYPHVGDKLYVLGSNEKIWVGTITSVAEPNGTGEANTVAMCLVRRADSIASSMKEMELEMDQLMDMEGDEDMGFVAPPPMDPLHGLEVIVGGTYTIGVLRSIPSRRVGPGQNWLEKQARESRNGLSAGSIERGDVDDDLGFINIERTRSKFGNAELLEQMKRTASSTSSRMNVPVVDVEPEVESVPAAEDEEATYQRALEEAEKAQKEAEAAAAEAIRKAEKMEMLKKRAEEALARRQNKQKQSNPPS